MRDIYKDPRVGDRVQIIPRVCDRLPEPLEITEVTPSTIYWHRPISKQKGMAAVVLWRDPRSFRLELLSAARSSDSAQNDMFGGAA